MASIDLGALRANLKTLRGRLREGVEFVAVVKADAYGHGIAGVAPALAAAGVQTFGVATIDEALRLRDLLPEHRILAWLWTPADQVVEAVGAGIELGVSSREQLQAVLAADAPTQGVHLKVDTGLGRNGAGPAERTALIAELAAVAGRLPLRGVMSHLACADVPGDPSVAAQLAEFTAVRRELAAAGFSDIPAHLANSAAILGHPQTHADLVRGGIALYGLGGGGPLRPSMTLAATIAGTKRVPADYGVSYGLTYRTAAETTLALVPIGYADGIPRVASGIGEVLVRGQRFRIAGRIAMDQFVIDVGDCPVVAGDEALIFGPGDQGEPTAAEWATWCDTIDYEIVTRLGPRVPRHYHRGED